MWHKLFPYVYERYLARQIYWSFLFILFALIALFVFFDFIGEMGDTNESYSSLVAFITVLLRVPSRMVEIMPIAVLIAGIYTFASMASQSEFTVLRVGGLHTEKAAWSLLKMALPLAVLILVMSELVGPFTENLSKNVRLSALNSGREALQLKSGAWIKDKLRNSQGEVIDGSRYINVGAIETNGSIRGLRMYEFDKNHRLLSSRTAELVEFKGEGVWDLRKVTETQFKELPASHPLDPSFSTRITKVDQLTIRT